MRHARKARGLALVLTGLLVGMLLITPATAHFTTNTKHLGKHAWQQFIKQKVFTKKQANNRFALKKLEAVRRVGEPGQPPFENGFANPPGNFETAGFYKDEFGIVHLAGDLWAPNPTSGGITAFTLPSDYRPATFTRFTVQAGADGNSATLRVDPDGRVRFWAVPNGQFVPINGVTFRPEPAAASGAGVSRVGGTSSGPAG